MKDFAKSIRVGNSNKAEIIEKKKKEGATLRVDNGQKLEFSDGTTYVKTTGSEDYREAHNYVGNASGAYNKLETEIRYAISEATVASKVLSGNFSATNIISALSHCKQCCDNAIKLAQEYDHEINK